MELFDLIYPTISPSLLAKKGKDLLIEAKKCEEIGISLLHFDFMRPPFVEGTGLSYEDFLTIHNQTSCLEDVHVMSDDVRNDGLFFLNHGADILTFHGTVSDKSALLEMYRLIHLRGKKAGIAINPNDSLEVIYPFLDLVDLVLVMGVIPGACGKASNPRGEEHLVALSKMKEERSKEGKKSFLLSFDGAVNGENGKRLIEEGANILVSGSYFFKGDKEEKRRILLGL